MASTRFEAQWPRRITGSALKLHAVGANAAAVAGSVVRCAGGLQVKKVMLIGEESEEGRVKLPIDWRSSADYRKCIEAPRSRSQCGGCCYSGAMRGEVTGKKSY